MPFLEPLSALLSPPVHVTFQCPTSADTDRIGPLSRLNMKQYKLLLCIGYLCRLFLTMHL